MQGLGVQHDVGEAVSVDRATQLELQWGRVKGAMDDLLRSFHSVDQRDSEALEDIFDYFVQKVEFDSPLAAPE